MNNDYLWILVLKSNLNFTFIFNGNSSQKYCPQLWSYSNKINL